MNCKKSFRKQALIAGITPTLEKTAERRAKARLGFVIHLMVFGIISTIQFIQGLISWDFSSVRGLVGWGLGLAIHGLVIYVSGFDLEKRLYQDELHRLKDK